MGAMCEICENRKDLELYIHIPFCIKKCNYCDFLSFPSSAEDREEYVRCLVKEIEQTGIVLNNKDTYQVRSVFIGGGTPSLLSGDQIKNIMQVVQRKQRLQWRRIRELLQRKIFLHIKMLV